MVSHHIARFESRVKSKIKTTTFFKAFVHRSKTKFKWDFDALVDTEIQVKQFSSYVKYTNKKVLEVVDKILAASKEPPIIVIQSDHGMILPEEFHTLPKFLFRCCQQLSPVV